MAIAENKLQEQARKDLISENIMVGQDGYPVLQDLTKESKSNKGCIHYLAPEVIEGMEFSS